MLIANITGTSPAAAGRSIVGSVAGDFEYYENVNVVASLVGATGGTLDITLQRELANNVWSDWIHFTQLAAGGAAVVYTAAVGVGGAAPIVTGVDTTALTKNPTLAAGVVAPGHPGQRVRCVAVAGVGTSAGAVVNIYLAACGRLG